MVEVGIGSVWGGRLFKLQGQASTLGMNVDAALRPRRFPKKGSLMLLAEADRAFACHHR